VTDRPDPSDWEDTAPLARSGFGPPSPTPDDPSWVPPVTQPPPRHYAGGPPPWQAPDQRPYGAPPGTYGTYYPPPGTQPMPAYAAAPVRHRQERGRVSRWVWPIVCALALIVGAIGGAFGGAVYEEWTTPSGEGLVAGGLQEAGARSTPPLPAQNGSVAAVAQEVLPSTVQILAQYQGQEDGATGSGFALDGRGHFVTNNHVVADAAEHDGPIKVVDQDGNRYEASVVGRSPTYDLAVLFVKDGPEVPAASLGASKELRVGDAVVAFGSPLGLSSTVTSGIVSALNRPVTTGDSSNQSSYINAVQTDAAINPGNSGGPLVNLRGQVVGVNSAIATTGGATQGEAGNIGVGFAIPIEQVEVTADQILRTGEARYPVIGAKVDTGEDEGQGAKISVVLPGTPAEKAGLREGDLVTQLDGTRVTDGISLIVAIRSHRPGDDVEFQLTRGGEELTLHVILGSEVG
jgi:putative serine protease PepD